MCKFFECILIAALVCFVLQISAKKYDVSPGDLNDCKILPLNGTGYEYYGFYHIPDMVHNKPEPDEDIHVRLYVQSRRDAHIMLSVSENVSSSDLIYEIVIGGEGNTMSQIRNQRNDIPLYNNTNDKYLMSEFEPTPIEIVQRKDGALLIFIPGYQRRPLMEYIDRKPLEVNYISFSSYIPSHLNAIWYYDCDFKAYEIGIDIKKVTPYERIIAKVMSAGNANIPTNLTSVNFLPQKILLNYEHLTLILKSEWNFMLSWKDERLRWDPNHYSNITHIVQSDIDIWTPSILLFNGVKKTLWRFSSEHKLHIYSNGNVFVEAKNVAFDTWCFRGLTKWPNKHLYCDLLMGLNELTQSTENELLSLHYIDNKFFINSFNEWKFNSLNVQHYVNDASEPLDTNGQLRMRNGDMAIKIQLKRNSIFLNDMFLAPILGCYILLLVSFFLRGFWRGVLILAAIIAVSMGWIYLIKYESTYYMAKLIFLYQHMLCVATFCYILHIYLMWLTLYPEEKIEPKNCIVKLVNATSTRMALCMGSFYTESYTIASELSWYTIANAYNNFNVILINIYLIIIIMWCGVRP